VHDVPDSPVYVIDGARTPFLKARGKPGPFTPADLAVQCGRPLLLRQPFAPSAFDEVILGCANQLADEMNVARVAALRLGCGANMPAWTVHRNCGSGMQSLDVAFHAIAEGRVDLVLAGGTEALSRTPLMVREAALGWLGRWRDAQSPVERMHLLADLDPHWLVPEFGLERGLTDPVVGLSMGQTAEVLAHRFGIMRAECDGYAAESHHRLAHAQAQGWLDEIEPMCDRDGQVFDHDDGVRPDTTPDKLAGLASAFEPPFGQVTAGNSSQITDGACWLVLASQRAVDEHGLEPLARIVDSEWAALDPSIMGLGPTLAATPLIERHGLSFDAVELWEINEAFAAQVLACLKAWEDEAYCREVLGLAQPAGRIAHERLNVDGGAIALGHPVGTSGARLVLHLVHALRRQGLRRGIASECIGGGQGGAMLVEAQPGAAS
jgi:acetyl-CoA C-acetyltransferase